jgi:hypothetical protein
VAAAVALEAQALAEWGRVPRFQVTTFAEK